MRFPRDATFFRIGIIVEARLTDDPERQVM
jgi:hypothetical protein